MMSEEEAAALLPRQRRLKEWRVGGGANAIAVDVEKVAVRSGGWAAVPAPPWATSRASLS